MRRPPALVVLAGVAAAALVPAAAHAQSGADIAAALKRNPVYSDPQARPALTPAQAERVRLSIAEKAPGRIAVAVVSARAARGAGGVRELARAIDRDFDVNGALVVIDSQGDNAWVVVSYDDPNVAVRAVQQGFGGQAPFFDHVLATVDRLGAADPGPGTPAGGPQTPQTTTPHTDVDVDSAVKTVFFVAGGVMLIIVLLIAIAVAGRTRRRRTDPDTGLATPPPATFSTSADAQRQAAEKAFGGDE